MKLLIPVDGSQGSMRALSYVIDHLGELRETPQILLINVQWKIATGNVKLFVDQATINDYYREQGVIALKAAREALDKAGLPYQYHVSIGTPAESIAQYAAEHGVDQIVMCRQGESGLQALLLGSVANRVLHLAQCPVLLVK